LIHKGISNELQKSIVKENREMNCQGTIVCAIMFLMLVFIQKSRKTYFWLYLAGYVEEKG